MEKELIHFDGASVQESKDVTVPPPIPRSIQISAFQEIAINSPLKSIVVRCMPYQAVDFDKLLNRQMEAASRTSPQDLRTLRDLARSVLNGVAVNNLVRAGDLIVRYTWNAMSYRILNDLFHIIRIRGYLVFSVSIREHSLILNLLR